MDSAAASAQITSNQLLAAADYQSKEIQQTSASVLETARAIDRERATGKSYEEIAAKGGRLARGCAGAGAWGKVLG